MIHDSQGWNLQEQYLIICLFILLFYRIVSFLTVYVSLPRYSYTKHVKQSTESNNENIGIDIMQNADTLNNNGKTNMSTNSSKDALNHNNNQLQRRASLELIPAQSRSCLSYCWLQLLFDCGYIMELAPWLWNWEKTKIILPEFAWFSKVYIYAICYMLRFCVLICIYTT